MTVNFIGIGMAMVSAVMLVNGAVFGRTRFSILGAIAGVTAVYWLVFAAGPI